MRFANRMCFFCTKTKSHSLTWVPMPILLQTLFCTLLSSFFKQYASHFFLSYASLLHAHVTTDLLTSKKFLKSLSLQSNACQVPWNKKFFIACTHHRKISIGWLPCVCRATAAQPKVIDTGYRFSFFSLKKFNTEILLLFHSQHCKIFVHCKIV